MFMAGIMINVFIGPHIVENSVNVNSKIYCNQLGEALLPWLDEHLLLPGRSLFPSTQG